MKFLVTCLNLLLGALAAAVLALAIVMAIIGRENTWALLFGAPPAVAIDFATLTPRETANSFLLCPESLCQKRTPDRVSPLYDLPPMTLAMMVREIVESTDGVRRDERVRRSDTNDAVSEREAQQASVLQWDYIATSRYLKFPDQITIRILDQGAGKSSLAIYSRAVYGRKDFGVNRNRITSWIEAVELAVARESGS